MQDQKITRRLLALYLGCEAQFTDLNPVTPAQTFVARIEGADIENLSKWDVKPILRPLSDISEKEAEAFLKLAYGEHVHDVSVLNGNAVFSEYRGDESFDLDCDFNDKFFFSPEGFDYLLSQSFDLFNLIEFGLAIDKTKFPAEIDTV